MKSNASPSTKHEPTAQQILLLMQFQNLHELLSNMPQAKWPSVISAENFAKLDHLLEEDLEKHPIGSREYATKGLRILLAMSRHHPDLDDLLAIADSPKMIENLRMYMHDDNIRSLISGEMTQEAFLAIIALSQKDINDLVSIMSKQIRWLLATNKISIQQLIELTDDQKLWLKDRTIRRFLVPDLLETPVPLITVEEVLALTAAEFGILTNHLFTDALLSGKLTIREVLNIAKDITTKKQLDEYINYHVKHRELLNEVLPHLDDRSREKLRGFSEKMIRINFSPVKTPRKDGVEESPSPEDEATSKRNEENLNLILDLPMEQKNKIINFKPELALNLFFRFRALPLDRVLALNKDELHFFMEVLNNSRLNEPVIAEFKTPGGFDRCYAAYKELAAQHPHAKNASQDSIHTTEIQADKFAELHRKINEFDEYGQSLTGKRRENACTLAGKIREQVNNYQKNPEKAGEVSQNLTKLLRDGKKKMGENRVFNDYIIPIILAASGVGLLILLGKKIATGSVFFNQTKRQQKIEEISSEYARVVRNNK